MNGTARKTPVWLIGVAVAAAGMVIATPATPAFACPGEQAWAASGETAGLLRTAVTSGLSSVQVSGGGPVNVPAGGTAPLTVTVVNTGSRFAGRIELEVRAGDPSGLPAVTMELQVNGAQTVTWRRLAEEGTPGARWFTVPGLSFQAGEVSTGFRLGVRPEALGKRLRITAHLRDNGGREVGATTFNATVTDAAIEVRGSFPAELRRGGAYQEFDVEVHNPSTRTYHNVRTGLAMTGLSAVPTPPEAGSLSAPDVRLERRDGGSWRRLTVHPGCDPTPSAALAAPFELAAGASRTLHLRIRLADSPATKPHPASYFLNAGPAGDVDAQGSLSGSFLIQPRQSATNPPAPAPPPTTTQAPQPTETQPPATPTPPLAAPANLPNTGTSTWPLAASIALVLGGTAAVGGAALLGARRRHRTGR
jgi:LPXTG cell wall anchor motif